MLKIIHHEDGTYNVCQNAGLFPIFNAAHLQKSKLYIELQQRKPKDKHNKQTNKQTNVTCNIYGTAPTVQNAEAQKFSHVANCVRPVRGVTSYFKERE